MIFEYFCFIQNLERNLCKEVDRTIWISLPDWIPTNYPAAINFYSEFKNDSIHEIKSFYYAHNAENPDSRL